MDKPGIASSEPSQFCHEKCVAWALEAAENRPAFAAPNKMNSTRCAHKMLHIHDDQAFVLVHTADRLGFSIYSIHCDEDIPKILPVAGGSAFLSQVSQLQVL